MPRLSAMVVLVSLAGVLACAATKPAWVSRGGGATDPGLLAQDDYQCQRENTYFQQPTAFGPFAGPLGPGPKLDTKRYEACMRARGWVRSGEAQ